MIFLIFSFIKSLNHRQVVGFSLILPRKLFYEIKFSSLNVRAKSINGPGAILGRDRRHDNTHRPGCTFSRISRKLRNFFSKKLTYHMSFNPISLCLRPYCMLRLCVRNAWRFFFVRKGNGYRYVW